MKENMSGKRTVWELVSLLAMAALLLIAIFGWV